MRMARLELARPKPHAPQTCVSTNSTTSAWLRRKPLRLRLGAITTSNIPIAGSRLEPPPQWRAPSLTVRGSPARVSSRQAAALARRNVNEPGGPAQPVVRAPPDATCSRVSADTVPSGLSRSTPLRPDAHRKLLIANRGEIALRILRTCRELGIPTVAVYSTVDRNALHVQLADEAVCVGEAPSAKSYLNVPNILAAATSRGADAIHPGYGFLAENADFAEKCHDHGITFVGPSPASILAMGDKSTAKTTMQGVAIDRAVHGDGGNAQFPTGAQDAQGDFATVGDQQFADGHPGGAAGTGTGRWGLYQRLHASRLRFSRALGEGTAMGAAFWPSRSALSNDRLRVSSWPDGLPPLRCRRAAGSSLLRGDPGTVIQGTLH